MAILRTFSPLSFLLAAGLLPAQIAPFATLGNVAPNRTFVDATIAVAQTNTAVHVFSSYLRAWFTQPVSPSASFTGFDDHVIVIDGTQAHALATRFGKWSSIPLSTGTAFVVPAPVPTHVCAVIDGLQAHLFSSYTGAWTTLGFSAPPTASVDKNVTLVGDGFQTWAASAYFAGVVACPNPAPNSFKASGHVGIAQDATAVHVFSCSSNTWTSLPATTATQVKTLTPRAGLVVLADPGPTFRFWSAFTGAVQTVTPSPSATLTYTDHVAVVVDAPFVSAFSSQTGTLQTKLCMGAITLPVLSNWLCIVQDAAGAQAFSAPRGAFAATLAGTFTFTGTATANTAAAQRLDGAALWLYSALTNLWYLSPTGWNSTFTLTNGGAAVVDSLGGLVGFGALEGTFTALPGVVPDAVFQWGGNVCLRAGTALHVFNAQIPAWRTQVTTQPASVQLHHAALLALAGTEVWFYGSHVDRWSHVTLTAPPSALVASDDCGFVQDGTTLYGFGATGQVSEVANHPEWWKVLHRGGPALWTLVGEPGAASVLFVSDASAAIPVPPLGTVLLDPFRAVQIVLPPFPADGVLRFSATVPNDPALAGLVLSQQAVILKPAQPYLTNVYRTMVF